MGSNMKLMSVFWAVLLLSFLPAGMSARHERDSLPRMPGAALLVGARTPEFLTLTRMKQTLTLLPEPNQPETNDWAPIYATISRDGQTVAGARLRIGHPRRVVISTYSVVEKRWTDYMEGDFAGSIAISPDSSRLAFSCNGGGDGPYRLCIIALKSKEELYGPMLASREATISWAPDGQHVAFSSIAAYSDPPAISVFDVETGETRRIAHGYQPAWSPSGEWIAYRDVRGRWMTIHPDGTGARVMLPVLHTGILFRRRRLFYAMPLWSPDSSHLLLNELVTEEFDMDIFLLDVKTLRLTRIFRDKAPVIAWVAGE